MSLINNIDHLARAPGVVSILVDAGHQQAHRGDHQDALRLALLLRDDLGVDVLGITARELTIFVQREPGRQTAAIVVETGHAVRKSLRRMIRKAARPKGRESIDTEGAEIRRVLNSEKRASAAAMNPEPAPIDAAEAFR